MVKDGIFIVLPLCGEVMFLSYPMMSLFQYTMVSGSIGYTLQPKVTALPSITKYVLACAVTIGKTIKTVTY